MITPALRSTLAVLALTLPLTSQENGAERPREFWKAITTSGYALPERESAYDLIVELSAHLGSPDSELRDDFGYGIPAAWIYTQDLLSAEELRALAALWTGNLEEGIGESGDDSVLLRSFSALDLSLLAARDNKKGFLGRDGFVDLLEATLVYLELEEDLRGWTPAAGWLHSAAHTADVLKFLARSRHLVPDEQALILGGIARRLVETDGYVFVHGEDDRLVAAVVSILARDDVDMAAVGDFIDELTSAFTRRVAKFDPVVFAGQQNARNFLRTLFVRLSKVADPDAGINDLRAKILQAL